MDPEELIRKYIGVAKLEKPGSFLPDLPPKLGQLVAVMGRNHLLSEPAVLATLFSLSSAAFPADARILAYKPTPSGTVRMPGGPHGRLWQLCIGNVGTGKSLARQLIFSTLSGLENVKVVSGVSLDGLLQEMNSVPENSRVVFLADEFARFRKEVLGNDAGSEGKAACLTELFEGNEFVKRNHNVEIRIKPMSLTMIAFGQPESVLSPVRRPRSGPPADIVGLFSRFLISVCDSTARSIRTASEYNPNEEIAFLQGTVKQIDQVLKRVPCIQLCGMKTRALFLSDEALALYERINDGLCAASNLQENAKVAAELRKASKMVLQLAAHLFLWEFALSPNRPADGFVVEISQSAVREALPLVLYFSLCRLWCMSDRGSGSVESPYSSMSAIDAETDRGAEKLRIWFLNRPPQASDRQLVQCSTFKGITHQYRVTHVVRALLVQIALRFPSDFEYASGTISLKRSSEAGPIPEYLRSFEELDQDQSADASSSSTHPPSSPTHSAPASSSHEPR